MANLDTKSLLEKAYEKLLPALGYLHGPVAGFAASVVVFTTWAARRAMSLEDRVGLELDENYKHLVEVNEKIREVEEEIKTLKEAMESTEDTRRRELMERRLRRLREKLDNLYDDYELTEVKIEAVKKILELGEEGVLSKIEKVVKDIEQNKGDEQLYTVLKALEERWRKREITRNTLEKILEQP